MANSRATNGRTAAMGDLFKDQVMTAQARVEVLEGEAKRVLEDLMARGRESRRDLEHLLQRLSRQDWSFPEVRERITRLKGQGVELRGKAEAFRAEAVERVMELQGRAIQFLGAASRDQVDELSRELDKLARRLDRAESKRGKKGSTKPSSRGV
ncbi:MAG: hypothetical protein QM704_16745 [Anaeromyxobacteraceae bacterium]